MRYFLASCCVVLAGCASFDGSSLRAGASEADVVRTMGEPALRLANPDGSRALVYPHGPLGIKTYIARLGRDGVLIHVDSVLNDDQFFHVQAGMTRDEVLRMIGPPGDTMAFARSNQVAWDYRYMDTWGYLAEFSVTFDVTGHVVSKFKRRFERDQGLF